jgi:hypothetical protein
MLNCGKKRKKLGGGGRKDVGKIEEKHLILNNES